MATSTPIDDLLAGHPTYRFVRPLSSGTFGVVALYHDLVTNEAVAIKFLKRGPSVSKYVQQEVLNHRWLKHPHIIKFKQLFLTPKHICIAMEFADGGTLFKQVLNARRLDEHAARWYFQQLVIALDYCHRPGAVKPPICNRDIKLENILLQGVSGSLPFVKVCDFGSSKNGFGSGTKTRVGTLVYMAPEVVQEDRCEGEHLYNGEQADVWSCGVCLYVMLAGRYPFYPLDSDGRQRAPVHTQDVIDLILQGDWALPQEIAISPECRDLLSRLLTVDPSQRLSMAATQRQPWFMHNLPGSALRLSSQCLAITDYSDVQSEQDIQDILRQAVHARQRIDDMIDAEIGQEQRPTHGAAGPDPFSLA